MHAPFGEILSLTDESRGADLIADGVVLFGVAPRASVGAAASGPDGSWSGMVSRGATLYDLASLTKPMFAMAFARSGIDRRTPLGDLLEEARGTATEDAPIELLLAHRAGLVAHVPLYLDLLDGRGTSPLPAASRSRALVAAASARRGELAEEAIPVEGYPPVYSDVGYILAGEAVARKLGAEDAGEVIRELVVEPLGQRGELGTIAQLEGVGDPVRERIAPTEIVPWRGGELHGVVHDENAWALSGRGGSGHAGLFGTARATLAFVCAAREAIRGRGPLAVDADGSTLGWLVRPRPFGSLRAGFDGKSEAGSSSGEAMGPRAFGHLGFTGTSFWVDPDADVAVVLLTNRVSPTRESTKIRTARPLVHDALFDLALSCRSRS